MCGAFQMVGEVFPWFSEYIVVLYVAYFDKEAIYGNGSERTRCCYCHSQ